MKTSIYFLLFISYHKAHSHISPCLSPIDYMEPPLCTRNIVKPLGLTKSYEYANLLFNTTKYTLNETQRDCILNTNNEMSNNIKQCVRQITINPSTIPIQVSRGLAQNNEDEWVSACAEDMPCVVFNTFVYNHTFSNVINECGANEIYNWLFKQTPFIQSTWYGIQYCQHIDPVHCFYTEIEQCSMKTYNYPCPISRWVYASNFMLLYLLSPSIAARMPGCRIPYNISNYYSAYEE